MAKFTQVQKLGALALTTGAWTYTTTGNIVALQHTAAAESSVLMISIPRVEPSSLGLWSDAVSVIKVPYTVGTADLSGAPTAVLNKVTSNPTTRVVSRVAVVQTLAFSGDDTVGIAFATPNHSADITITTPAILGDNAELVLELTFPCAATSVVKVFGVDVTNK